MITSDRVPGRLGLKARRQQFLIGALQHPRAAQEVCGQPLAITVRFDQQLDLPLQPLPDRDKRPVDCRH